MARELEKQGHGIVDAAIAAEVARTYIDLRGTQYRLNVARRNAQNQQKTYQLTLDPAEERNLSEK